MIMHITPLTMHYSAEQAAELLELLDTLRDALWDTYGEQILDLHRELCAGDPDESPCELDFNDDIPF